MSVILETKQLCKFYGAGENQVKAVNQVDIQIEQGAVSYTHLQRMIDCIRKGGSQ